MGKAITSRMDLAPQRIATRRSNPKATPPWGGAPNSRASRRKPNFSSASVGGDFQGLKNRLLDIPAVDPDAAAADLGAVEHQVVGPGPDLPRVGGQQGDVFLLGRGKGVVHGGKAVRLGVILQQGKVGDPGQAPGVLGDQPFPFGQIEPAPAPWRCRPQWGHRPQRGSGHLLWLPGAPRWRP